MTFSRTLTGFIQLSKYEQAALGQLSRVMSPAGDDGQIPVSPRPGRAGRGNCLGRPVYNGKGRVHAVGGLAQASDRWTPAVKRPDM